MDGAEHRGSLKGDDGGGEGEERLAMHHRRLTGDGKALPLLGRWAYYRTQGKG